MQAMLTVFRGRVAQLESHAARPFSSLLSFFEELTHRRGYATHGITDSQPSREGGPVRFYKTVNVREAGDGKVRVLLSCSSVLRSS